MAACLLAFAVFVATPALRSSSAGAAIDDAETIAQLVDQPAFDPTTHAEILRLYQAIFGRSPDIAGAKYWINVSGQGFSVLEIAGFMSGSAEWAATYQGTSDADFVSKVYTNVLGRGYDSDGYEYWLALVRSGSLQRPQMVFYVTANAEFTSAYPFQPVSSQECSFANRVGVTTMITTEFQTSQSTFDVYDSGGRVIAQQRDRQLMYRMDAPLITLKGRSTALVQTSAGDCGRVDVNYLQSVDPGAVAQYCVSDRTDFHVAPSESSASARPADGTYFSCNYSGEYDQTPASGSGKKWIRVTYSGDGISDYQIGWVRTDVIRWNGFSACTWNANYCGY